MKQFRKSVDEALIERIIRHGTADISEHYLNAIRAAAAEYSNGISRRLREHEYDPELMRLHVVGGESCIIKNFADYDKERVIINDDICATAKGYRFSGMGKYYASEVTLNYGSADVKRVDFMQFKPPSTYSVSGIERASLSAMRSKAVWRTTKAVTDRILSVKRITL